MKKFFVAIGIFVIFILLFIYRVPLKESFYKALKPDLPEPKSADFFEKIPPPQPSPPSSPIAPAPALFQNQPEVPPQSSQRPPAKETELNFSINLDIPFGSQAPFGNWDMPYQEACEEAAMIMVDRYFDGQELTPEIMDREILDLVEWQVKTFGYYQDTTADEIVRTLREYFKIKNVEVRTSFSMEDIKKEVTDGHPVILPAAGRLLPNPYFRQPGPLYHALVVKGFLQNGKIITNDPGTRNGADFLYDPKALFDAIHDWDAEDIQKGRKAMIVVK